jgi:hypothetical protein
VAQSGAHAKKAAFKAAGIKDGTEREWSEQTIDVPVSGAMVMGRGVAGKGPYGKTVRMTKGQLANLVNILWNRQVARQIIKSGHEGIHLDKTLLPFRVTADVVKGILSPAAYGERFAATAQRTMDFAAALQKHVAEDLGPKVNARFEAENGFPLAMEQDFWHRQRDPEFYLSDAHGPWESKFGNAHLEDLGMVKPVTEAKAPYKIGNILDVYDRYVQRAGGYIHKAPAANDMRATLVDPAFRKAIRTALGKKEGDQALKNLTDFVGDYERMTFEEPGAYDRGIRALIRAKAGVSLGGKLQVAFGQAASYPNYAETLGTENVVDLKALSPEQHRIADAWGMKQSPFYRHRAESSSHDVMTAESSTGKPSKVGKVRDATMVGIHAMDMLAVRAGLISAAKKLGVNMAELVDAPYDDPRNEALRQLHDRATRRSQSPIGHSVARSEFDRLAHRRPELRLFFGMFRMEVQNNFNMFARALDIYRRALRTQPPKPSGTTRMGAPPAGGGAAGGGSFGGGGNVTAADKAFFRDGVVPVVFGTYLNRQIKSITRWLLEAGAIAGAGALGIREIKKRVPEDGWAQDAFAEVLGGIAYHLPPPFGHALSWLAERFLTSDRERGAAWDVRVDAPIYSEVSDFLEGMRYVWDAVGQMRTGETVQSGEQKGSAKWWHSLMMAFSKTSTVVGMATGLPTEAVKQVVRPVMFPKEGLDHATRRAMKGMVQSAPTQKRYETPEALAIRMKQWEAETSKAADELQRFAEAGKLTPDQLRAMLWEVAPASKKETTEDGEPIETINGKLTHWERRRQQLEAWLRWASTRRALGK